MFGQYPDLQCRLSSNHPGPHHRDRATLGVGQVSTGRRVSFAAAATTKQAIESRVLSGLKDRMLALELVAAFVKEFAAECARLSRDRAGEDFKLNKERAVVERSLQGIMTAIEDGSWNEILRCQRRSKTEPPVV